MRGVFLDISKAFDKVWHIGLLFKLKAYDVDGELLSLLENYLENRKQRVVLNGQNSEWREINSGVPQGSVLGPLLFLIYINDLPDGITSICKTCVDDTFLFSKVLDVNEPTKKLNLDLEKISEWAFQKKMQFNHDPNKQANEVIFSQKSKFHSHPPLTFNNNDVKQCPHQSHLDLKLDFNIDVDNKVKTCYRMIGIIKRLSISVPRKALLTIYKSLIRPHLDYGDILYDKPGNQNFQNKLEKFQFKACLVITGAIQGTSRQKNYNELGLDTLIERRWRGKLTFFYETVNVLLPEYLYLYLKFPSQENYPLRSALTTKINPIPSRSKTFRNTFSCIV